MPTSTKNPQPRQGPLTPLSDYRILYMKLRAYHWTVTGPLFFGLHAKFEEPLRRRGREGRRPGRAPGRARHAPAADAEGPARPRAPQGGRRPAPPPTTWCATSRPTSRRSTSAAHARAVRRVSRATPRPRTWPRLRRRPGEDDPADAARVPERVSCECPPRSRAGPGVRRASDRSLRSVLQCPGMGDLLLPTVLAVAAPWTAPQGARRSRGTRDPGRRARLRRQYADARLYKRIARDYARHSRRPDGGGPHTVQRVPRRLPARRPRPLVEGRVDVVVLRRRLPGGPHRARWRTWPETCRRSSSASNPSASTGITSTSSAACCASADAGVDGFGRHYDTLFGGFHAADRASVTSGLDAERVRASAHADPRQRRHRDRAGQAGRLRDGQPGDRGDRRRRREDDDPRVRPRLHRPRRRVLRPHPQPRRGARGRSTSPPPTT